MSGLSETPSRTWPNRSSSVSTTVKSLRNGAFRPVNLPSNGAHALTARTESRGTPCSSDGGRRRLCQNGIDKRLHECPRVGFEPVSHKRPAVVIARKHEHNDTQPPIDAVDARNVGIVAHDHAERAGRVTSADPNACVLIGGAPNRDGALRLCPSPIENAARRLFAGNRHRVSRQSSRKKNLTPSRYSAGAGG